jgi:hypothetical protein
MYFRVHLHVQTSCARTPCIVDLHELCVTGTLRSVQTPGSGEPTTTIRGIAEALAGSLPAAAIAGILGEHVADSSGHCRGCRFPTTASPVWPCRLWAIADEMRRMRLEPPRG